jgi:hypothetical protein
LFFRRELIKEISWAQKTDVGWADNAHWASIHHVAIWWLGACICCDAVSLASEQSLVSPQPKR